VRVIFLGPPGAGKGTQARILHERFGLGQISTGDILRVNCAQGTPLGDRAESYMRRGELVPDDLVIAMIENELRSNPTCFVMDGFPRTVGQAEALDALLTRNRWPLDAAILFAPVGDLVLLALAALDRGGTLAVAGIHLSAVPSLDYENELFEERQLRSVTANTRADGEELLTLAGRLALRVVTTGYRLEEADRALADLAHDRVRGAAVLHVGRGRTAMAQGVQ